MSSNKHTPRILIVEDEAFIAMALEMDLVDSGFDIAGPAARLSEAFAIVETEKIDGAILDVMLGREEIFPFADRLVELGVPFVFHSGHINKHAIEERYNVPAYKKPALPEALIGSISSLVSKTRALKRPNM